MSAEVPISGEVLAWALTEAGHTRESLARAVGVAVEKVHRWIAETDAPSPSKLQDLAAALRRPSAVLLLPHPPAGAASVAAAFRAAPGTEPGDRLSPTEAAALRDARRRQDAAASLLVGTDAVPVQIPSASVDRSAATAARDLRAWLGVDVDQQLSWKSASAALTGWREALEDRGVLAFMLSLGDGAMRGFSLADPTAPVVAANTTGYPQGARIFTWWHELGHLALGDDGICERYYFRSGARVERWCERLAATALLPSDRVIAEVEAQFGIAPGSAEAGLEEARWVARRFHTSLTATAIRLIKLQLAPDELYDDVRAGERARTGGGGGGEHRPETRLRELGGRFTGLVLDGMAEGRLPVHEGVDYLRMQVSEIARLETMLAERSGS